MNKLCNPDMIIIAHRHFGHPTKERFEFFCKEEYRKKYGKDITMEISEIVDESGRMFWKCEAHVDFEWIDKE